jgi:hypothetical protein
LYHTHIGQGDKLDYFHHIPRHCHHHPALHKGFPSGLSDFASKQSRRPQQLQIADQVHNSSAANPQLQTISSLPLRW